MWSLKQLLFTWLKERNIMSFEKVVLVDSIEVVENGCIQVRTRTDIKEDNVEISSKFHRHIVLPGDDYSGEDAKVQAIAASIHTPEVIAAYQEKLAEQQIPAA
jgi:hypothetical protein